MTKVRLSMITVGVIVGIVGLLHGIAELLQGSDPVTSRSVEALPAGWPNDEFNSMTNGSPVFTVLTDLPFYALGTLAILVSTLLIVCSVTVLKTVDIRLASALFGILSIGIFLFGAGRGTPVALSLPVVVVGLLSGRSGRAHSRDKASRRTLLTAFWGFYGLHIASWVLFFPGLFIYSFYAEISTALFVVAFVSMPIGSFGALISGYQLDRAEEEV